jgi:hypothetical protein
MFVPLDGKLLVPTTVFLHRLILTVLSNTDGFVGVGFESVQAAIEFALAIFSLQGRRSGD